MSGGAVVGSSLTKSATLAFVVILTGFAQHAGSAHAQCPASGPLTRFQGLSADDAAWAPIARAVRLPRPWASSRMEDAYGLRLVSIWQHSPGQPCPTAVVAREAREWEQQPHVLGYSLLGLDDRGRVIVVTRELTGPITLADPRVPDVDGDGFSEHFVVTWPAGMDGYDLDRVACVPSAPATLQLISSRGAALTDAVPYRGQADMTQATFMEVVARYADTDVSACPRTPEWTDLGPPPSDDGVYDELAGVSVVAERGAWVVVIDRTSRTCRGFANDPQDIQAPRCSEAVRSDIRVALRLPSATPSTPAGGARR